MAILLHFHQARRRPLGHRFRQENVPVREGARLVRMRAQAMCASISHSTQVPSDSKVRASQPSLPLDRLSLDSSSGGGVGGGGGGGSSSSSNWCPTLAQQSFSAFSFHPTFNLLITRNLSCKYIIHGIAIGTNLYFGGAACCRLAMDRRA
jgi:hypothetical protein